MNIVRMTALALASCLATPALGGSSNHGGDGVRLLFAKARFTALEMVRSYAPVTNVTNPDIDAWLAIHKESLARDIEISNHQLTEDVLPHDAMTSLEEASTIILSLPILRSAFYTHERATELLIHESVHHLNVSDETFADAVALAVTKSNEARQPPRQIEARIVAFDAPPSTDASETANVRGVALESDVFVWTSRKTGARGYLFDPVSRTWREVAETGQPSRRLNPTIVSGGTQLFLWGGPARSLSSGVGGAGKTHWPRWVTEQSTTPLKTNGAQ